MAVSINCYCGNLHWGGFPQTGPKSNWPFRIATAMTTYATGTSRMNICGYPGHPGELSSTRIVSHRA